MSNNYLAKVHFVFHFLVNFVGTVLHETMKPIKFKPYSIMDKLGLDDNCQFEFFFSYLDHYYQHLSKLYDMSNIIDIKAFLLRGVSKILDIEQSTYLLASEKRDLNSILVLIRTALIHDIGKLFTISKSKTAEFCQSVVKRNRGKL